MSLNLDSEHDAPCNSCMRVDTSAGERMGLRMVGIRSKPVHLSSENGSSMSLKQNPSVGDFGGGGINVRRVRRCLCEGGGGGGLRWLVWEGVSLREMEIGPVVVEMREMGRFLEGEFMKNEIRVGGTAGLGG